jgi:hypothetical protein
MEIERYTLATGETVLTGFSRLGRHWGIFFVILAFLSNLWPGWATSSATLVTYAVGGGSVRWIAVAILVSIGLILTLSPVVYRALEGAQTLKVIAVGGLILIAALFAIPGRHVAAGASKPCQCADACGTAWLGASARRPRLCGRWRRTESVSVQLDPRQGARHGLSRSAHRQPAHRRTRRAQRHRLAVRNNAGAIVALAQVVAARQCRAIIDLRGDQLLHHPVHLHPRACDPCPARKVSPRDIGFLKIEGDFLSAAVGGWFGTFFWVVGAFSLFAASLGIVDYTSRLAADVIRTVYWRGGRESLIYAGLVWAMVGVGCGIIASGMDQPLVLLVIAGCVAAFMMFIYSALLIVLNRRLLAPELGPARPCRRARLGRAPVRHMSAITIADQGCQRKWIDQSGPVCSSVGKYG